jgi:hypothetical protein
VNAYALGLVLGALCSALIVSRVLFWLTRNRAKGRARAVVANGASLLVIVLVSVVVRGALEWQAVVLHLLAQSAWLAVDLLVETDSD